jgi:hypothetical protein
MRHGISSFLIVLGIAASFRTSAAAQESGGDVAAVAQAIDRAIQQPLDAKKIKTSPRTDDAEFLRRVTLDITGRIPTAERAADFLVSTDPDRRRKLIDELLANPLYGEHFAGNWIDLIHATGSPPRSMTAGFRKWLAAEFNQGHGWDKTVHEMLTAEGTKPAGYFVRANFKEPGQLAGTTARFFLGVRMECAECHNHPFTNWKQTDYWGLAAFYTRLKQVNAKGGNLLTEDSPPGKKPKTPGLGARITIPNSGVRTGAGKVVKAKLLKSTEPNLPDEGPLRPTLASWITAKENPYFAQAAVHRLWAHLFGSGFFSPIDDRHDETAPSHPQLLQLLSREFVASGHDLKHLMRCITNSETYQRTSRPIAANKEDSALFSHMAVRVMNADVLFDSLVTALGNPKLPGGLGAPLPYEIYAGGASKNAKPSARAEFIKFFDTRDADSGNTTEYTHGIPQVLALLNAKQFNTAPPIVDKLVKSKVSKEKAVDTLFLAALTRYPTASEMKLMTGFVERRKDLPTGYTGVLWILFNSNEFVLNH